MAAESLISEFKPQDLASTAWAFATVKQSGEKLFADLTKAAEHLVSELKPQEIANTLWAFAAAQDTD